MHKTINEIEKIAKILTQLLDSIIPDQYELIVVDDERSHFKYILSSNLLDKTL